jgi:flavorubredoxin
MMDSERMTSLRITVAYASHFGSTAKLAEHLAAGLRDVGATPLLIDVSANRTVAVQPMVLLTSIIWDRPIPAMREWIADNSALARQCTVACGVVCGSAGVRENGGMTYAHQLAKRLGRPDVFQFALCGEIPSRDRIQSWQWWALKIFAGVMRSPELFSIQPDVGRARTVGNRIGAYDSYR